MLEEVPTTPPIREALLRLLRNDSEVQAEVCRLVRAEFDLDLLAELKSGAYIERLRTAEDRINDLTKTDHHFAAEFRALKGE